MANRIVQRKNSTDDITAAIDSIIASTEELQFLERLHFKLVSYYTFLSNRQHIITTFDLFKEHIAKTLDHILTFEDVAKLKTITPNNINFEYVDKNNFILEEKHFNWRDGYKQREADIFDIDKDNFDTDNQVLILEFIDSGNKSRRENTEKLLPGVIKKLIIRRDNRFRKDLRNLVRDKGDNTLQYIQDSYKKYIPDKQKFIDPMEEMNQEKIESSHQPIPQLINHFKTMNNYNNQLSDSSRYIIPPKPAKYDPEFFHEVSLHPDIESLLDSKNIQQIYSHQSLGLRSVLLEGKHVISTTSTSSGKSLIYQLPIIQTLLNNSEETSLLLFPTKALSQDQHRALLSFIGPTLNKITDKIQTFDGDTSKQDRRLIRESANVILTNPDMIHLTLLPNHTTWARFLRNLKYVVIDELHVYKGTFGTNVAYILRRLRRICELFGNTSIQFISSSATLNDADLHLSKMVGLDDKSDIVWIDETMNGSPCGSRYIVGWNPDLDRGGSMISDTSRIIVELLKKNTRTIVFCTVRKTVELVMKEVRSQLKDEPKLLSQIMSYRGGYSISDRRKIEHQMFHGGLSCIVATNALEVGIDIGGLDVVLMCGFPISLSGFEQEMGRAGRRGLDSLCLLVAGGDPISQYYIGRMNELVERKEWEDLCIDLNNLLVWEGQLQCAFKELEVPNSELSNEWNKWWNCIPWEMFENVIREKFRWTGTRWTCRDSYLPFPAIMVPIRAIDEDTFAVVDISGGRQEVIETLEMSRTTFTLYEGGIFIHQGLPYLVKEFDVNDKFALVERVNVDWTTSQRDYTDVDPVLIERVRALKFVDIPIYYGNIVKTSVVFGFFKVDKRGKILDTVEVNNPPVKYKSKGVWIDLPTDLVNLLKNHELNLAGAIHAVEHGVMNILPRYISVGNYDEIGCECKAPEKEFAHRQTQRRRPARLLLFDTKGGKQGNGLSSRIFACAELILQETLKIVEECTCPYGCPLCCAGMQCTENSLVLSKDGCRVILRYLLHDPTPLDGIPRGPEGNLPDIDIETVVPVQNVGNVKLSPLVEVVKNEKSTEGAIGS